MIIHALTSTNHHDSGDTQGRDDERSLTALKKNNKEGSSPTQPPCHTVVSPAAAAVPHSHCPCDTDIDQLHKMAQEIEVQDANKTLWGGIQGMTDQDSHHQHGTSVDGDNFCEVESQLDGCGASTMAGNDEDDEETGVNSCRDAQVSAEQRKKLLMSSINTAVAIAAHNFPEGLATFVSALADPSVGAVLAVAIAIHNIPEGICVSLPIYYATGNRCRAFFWGMLSGFSEIFAALLGWLILADHFGDTLYGVLFGLVAGMMVIISIKELLPTAHRYDPHDSLVTTFYIIGMGIMALSLVLFTA